jgi:hypothetical protein
MAAVGSTKEAKVKEAIWAAVEEGNKKERA